MDYDAANYNPPAPVVQVTVLKPYSTLSKSQRGKLDSGADISVIPFSCVAELGLVPARRLIARGYDGRQGPVTTYYANLSFQYSSLELVEVAATPRSDVLIGRDILNRFKTLLDGKTLSFELQDP